MISVLFALTLNHLGLFQEAPTRTPESPALSSKAMRRFPRDTVRPLLEINMDMRRSLDSYIRQKASHRDFERDWNLYLVAILSQDPKQLNEGDIPTLHQTVILVDDIFLTTQSTRTENQDLLFATERTRDWLEGEIARLMLTSERLSHTARPKDRQIQFDRPLRRSLRVSSPFGRRRHPVSGRYKLHKGTDFRARRGTTVLAAGPGIVKTARRYGSYGNYIVIEHPNGFQTAYAHLSQILVKPGQHILTGKQIGTVGSTGRSTGPHLHFEVRSPDGRFLDPESIL